jgi:hypothetical protein
MKLLSSILELLLLKDLLDRLLYPPILGGFERKSVFKISLPDGNESLESV